MFKWISRWWYEEKYDKEPEKEACEATEACEAIKEPEELEHKKTYLDVVKEIVEDEPPPVPPRN